jgi:hypothetical protein
VAIDPQAGCPQGSPGLGDLDDGIGDLGHLGLGRAVGEADVGLHAALGEPAPR